MSETNDSGLLGGTAREDHRQRAPRREIEVRYATLDGGERVFDEIVAVDAYVHLEKMNDSEFCLIVETRGERACFSIGARRAPVSASESWREPINRASEGQKRRWAGLTPEQRRRRKR